MRTEEITAPGFIHDVMATTLVLFLTSPAYGAIGKDLEARGFAVAHTRSADRRAAAGRVARAVLAMDRTRNIATFERLRARRRRALSRAEMDSDGRRRAVPVLAARRLALVAARWRMTIAREAWRRGPRALAGLVRRGARAPARDYLETTYRIRRRARALGAVGCCIAASIRRAPIPAQMVKVIAFAVELAGLPDRDGRREDAARARSSG